MRHDQIRATNTLNCEIRKRAVVTGPFSIALCSSQGAFIFVKVHSSL